jgi:hypothetical protein
MLEKIEILSKINSKDEIDRCDPYLAEEHCCSCEVV